MLFGTIGYCKALNDFLSDCLTYMDKGNSSATGLVKPLLFRATFNIRCVNIFPNILTVEW